MTVPYQTLAIVAFILLITSHTVVGALGDGCESDTNCTLDLEVCNETTTQCICNIAHEQVVTTCVKKCPAPPPIENGSGETVPNVETVILEAVYSCDLGFVFEGDVVKISCDSEGNWTGPTPACIPQDPCVDNPCPVIDNVPVECTANVSGPGHVCICPDGFKGADCGEVDSPIICNNRVKRIRFETNPNEANRTKCFSIDGYNETFPCYGEEGETIKYSFDPTGYNITVYNKPGFYCLTYLYVIPDEPTLCVDILAHEYNDFYYRPWLNDTLELCFIFNKEPRIDNIPPRDLKFNVVFMPTDVVFPLYVDPREDSQTVTLTYRVIPDDRSSFIAVEDGNLTITNPKLITLDPIIDPTADIYNTPTTIELTATDDGIPVQESFRNLTVVYKYLDFECSSSKEFYLLHLVPMPEAVVELGTIQCTLNGDPANNALTLDITSESGPVNVTSDRVIQYVPWWSEVNHGTFSIMVEGSKTVTDFNLTSDVSFTVLADDLQPNCTASGNTATFSEKDVIDTCSEVLYSCTDNGDLYKYCTDLSDNFYVNCSSTGASNDVEVRICVEKSPDSLGDASDEVTITVTNEHVDVVVDTDELTIAVTIENVNDPPVLLPETTPIDIIVPENKEVNEVLVTIPVADPDMLLDPPSDSLSATVTDLDSGPGALVPFDVNVSDFGNAVSLVLTDALEGAVREFYSLELKVEDAGGLSDSVTINIAVQDINEAPVCEPSFVTVQATVRDDVEHIITSLTCTDPDYESPNNDLTYTLQESASAAYVYIDELGVVRLSTGLQDYTSNVLEITIDVTDGGGLNTSVTVQVSITSDYPPVCDNSLVSNTVSEKLASDECFPVSIPCVDDVDATGQLEYVVNNGNATDHFTLVDPAIIINQELSICPSTDLQGLVGRYVFIGVVSSQYGDTDLEIRIDVEDVNDPPACTDPVYEDTVAVTENTGFQITILTCVDLDFTPDFKTLTYIITDDTGGYFAVNPNGVVSLGRRLTDITSETTLSFNVVVSDTAGLSDTIPLQITVDANFPPVCDQAEVTISKAENTDSNVCFVVENVCEDIVISEDLTYTIWSNSNGTSLFSINDNDSTNQELYVCTINSLQGLYGNWELNVAVTSSYGQINVSIIITVIDQNDAPTFVGEPYSVDVFEDKTLHSVIYALSAIDLDSGAFGQFSFSAVESAFYEKFTLNATTGEIKLFSSFNAEESTVEEYTIEVKDEGSPQLSATTTFTVNILDVNDEKPVCTPASTSIYVELLLPVGSYVYTVSCTDADISDAYNQIVYSTTSDYFEILANGTLILSKALPREELSHEIRVQAADADKPGNELFVTEIIINAIVDRDVPPVCDSTSISLTLEELETVGKCVDREVICTDPTGQQVTFEYQQGDASTSGLFEIRTHGNTGSLGLNACIKDSLRDQFNTYELIGVVSNGLGTSTVRWSITIVNVNEAPVFVNGPYTIDLPETTPISQSPVLETSVSDPDDGKGESSFELSSISAIATNDDDYNPTTADAFLFLPSTASFYVIKTFNATVRDLYTFTVTASDNSGLSSTTEVTINITDVNSPPMCEPWSVESNTDILADIDTDVVSVYCYDTDINPEYTTLSYAMSTADPYFDVTSEGTIYVANKLPRSLLYDTGHATFYVLVSDGGLPSLSASVYVDITVDNKIPAECNPVITPPEIWVQFSCADITMDCTDPTIDGTDHLTYETSGNFTGGFEPQPITDGVLRLCYQNLGSAEYEISIKVSNGLQDATFTEIIVVSYLKAAPVFDQAKYTVTVDENTQSGVRLLAVNATAKTQVGEIVYAVIDTPSLDEWDSYISLDSSSGTISTVQPLKNLADTVITLKVEAEDIGSKLKSSTQVEIKIEDLNEVPTCRVTSTNLNNIDVDVDVGTKLALFNCSDPDVKTEYRTLSYSLSGDSVNTYFELVGEPPNAIAVKSELHISTTSYTITLTVQDGGTPPLAVTKIFGVTVSILPPPVEVVVASKTHTSILIEFSYIRDEFYTVTEYFKVKALTVNDEVVHESSILGSTAQTYNITGLDAETPYSIVVEATTPDAGTRKSKTLIVITRVVPVLSYITFTCIVPNVEFTDRMRDKESQIYYTNRQTIVSNIEVVLSADKGYAGIPRLTIRPWNSIAVDTVVALNQSADPQATMKTLERTVKSGWLNLLYVNSGYFVGSFGAGYIAIEDIIQSSSEVYNGTAVSLECNIETIGYLATDSFTIWWTYQGNIIQPTPQSRYRISTVTDPVLYEKKSSLLEIDPVLTSNAGEYGCHVLDNAQQEKRKLHYVDVIGQPIVVIEPMSQMVQYGDTVTVSCMLAMSPGVFESFVWFRNGDPYVQTSNEAINEGGKFSNITIRDIKKTMIFACQGFNQAGGGAPAVTTISVVPQDITVSEMCPEVTERGITWARSAPGTIIRLSCETGYTGERQRECGNDGVWKKPFYNCVLDQIQLIEEQVNELKDGASSTTLDQVLDNMVAETGDNRELLEGDLQTSVNVLADIVDISSTTDKDEIKAETERILEIASNMIDEIQTENWVSKIETLNEGAIAIPGIVEQYLDKKLDNLLDDDEDSYTVKNIYVHVGAIKQSTYTFPERTKELPPWVESSGTGLKIPGDAFKDLASVHYAISFYRDISPILAKKTDGSVEDITDKYDINADIISFQVKEQLGKLNTPAEITFQHYDLNHSNPICTYWDFDKGTFLTDGVVLVSTNDEYTVCASDHFTNFALLMSPGKTPEADLMALSIISAVGCGISIACLVLTIILYLLVWRYVKSDRAVLLLNLCVALIISYVIFLAGINRAENATICTVISALLHYFYLVVFFLMLAYGIEIAICVVYVFVTRSRLKWLLPLAWGIPLLIVGITLGATQLEGYGNDRFCWLSTEDGVLWAFVGPAALIIVINFVIVVIVLRQMFKSSVMMTKSDKEKAVTGVRSICVLLPILGLTWVFGIFSVNESLVAFQYIFAICNTLQGFLIFLFHCILNTQLKQALKQRNEKRKSMASIESTFKNQQSSTGSSGAFYSTDSKSTQLKNNMDSETTATSNPFLQADRQMKELVAKNKTTGNINEVNNKVDKDLKSKPVDLDDVKISNILRESEVMGGTAGISSILHEQQPKDELPSLHDTKASSHKYDYIDPYGMNRVTHNSSGHGSGSGKHSAHSDRSRERRQRSIEREREEERLKQIEYEKRDRQERERKEREKREREKIERDRKEREKREKEKHKNKNVIKIGYGSDTYLGADSRSRDHSYERRGPHRPHGPSRADDDYEGNISSISTALPEKFDFYQGNKRQKEAKKQAESLQKKKEKKKSSLKERSAPYEYSYDSTYLGGSSRHASLENMNMQHYGYSPYAQMPGMGGYQTGRPTHQQQHWDQYRYQRDPRDPYSRDYY